MPLLAGLDQPQSDAAQSAIDLAGKVREIEGLFGERGNFAQFRLRAFQLTAKRDIGAQGRDLIPGIRRRLALGGFENGVNLVARPWPWRFLPDLVVDSII
jgi:hypothetical protein